MRSTIHEQATVSEVWEPEGYGYLRTRAGERVFFRRHSIRGYQFHRLFVGTEVGFQRRLGVDGWEADDVFVVGQNARLLPL